MPNPLTKIINWYLSPIQEAEEGCARTGLGVLPCRPADTDIVAYLINRGLTPATEDDVRTAFATLFEREATAFEELLACSFVDSFALLAR
ncbi:hypothetical protein [Corynebacterium terpenotabidum]|uniref:Uncharacterized protein n=1 Tax=Corynebacterium terpenotabidum Y-11 TaxID=1200352 RepID=S4XGD7_9CORY|nr:hypothetical protein [Corynebacterium terpenotabidum]AGP31644.1 hypothetical protein A606_10025 [Corynebacterium terpenotabidum Y-11]